MSNNMNRGNKHNGAIASQENIKIPRQWPLCGEFTGTGEFPGQRASNAENVSIWWRHHGLIARNIAFPYHSLATIEPRLSETREQHQPIASCRQVQNIV